MVGALRADGHFEDSTGVVAAGEADGVAGGAEPDGQASPTADHERIEQHRQQRE